MEIGGRSAGTMKEYWNEESNILLERLGTSKDGLTEEQVQKIRLEKGENLLMGEKKDSVIQVFVEQFKDLLVIILLLAAIISMLSGNTESTIVIFAVLILNAILGTVQHVKAEKSIESLKKLSSPVAKVIRNGKKREVMSSEIVPGDMVLLEAGDMIVADGRIINNYSLQVNESSLTGESENVDKSDAVIEGNVALADRVNMVYSGSLVTYGRAEILITATGMETEIGKIATLMNETKERKTPLQVSLDNFSQKLAILIMVICVLVFGLCLMRSMPLLDSLMFAVALAVAAIPEALGSIVTIVQAMGTQKMATENAIIKELKAVESLGCVSVICSDKTGTLTQNKMTVQNIFVDGEVLRPTELQLTNQIHRYLLYDAVLSNDSSIIGDKGVGDPTEYALLEMFREVDVKNNGVIAQSGLHEDYIRDSVKRLEEIPFDSDRKLMSIRCNLHGKSTVLVKGAPDVLLARCDKIGFSDGIKPMSEKDSNRIVQQNHDFSREGLRVLAFGYKESEEKLELSSENKFIFLGLVAMVDPPREESTAAVADAKMAGIRTVMITGDHKVTAVAIASKIGIYAQDDIAVTGAELDAMSDEELENKIEHISVYARVSPENKIRIVEMWQRIGKIVSMTGDGVNDAPALKKADIGVAMGITGTEVSKDAASMILADDNFATIIKAVTNGRNIYRNIKNAIQFLLSGNMAGIMCVLYTSIVGLAMPFAPVHLLFINLLTDSLPAIAIGVEPSDRALLKEKPRDPSTGILSQDFVGKILVQGALIAIATMTAYYVGNTYNTATAMTMAFATLTLARLFHGFNCRSTSSIFKLGLFSNKYSVLAFLGGVALLALVLFVPILSTLFSVSHVSSFMAGQIALLAFMPTIAIQGVKTIRETIKK